MRIDFRRQSFSLYLRRVSDLQMWEWIVFYFKTSILLLFSWRFKSSFSFFRLLISAIYELKWASEFCTFLVTWLSILRALLAYTKVLYVYSLFPEKGDTQASIIVLQLPPKASFNILVNLLYLYGMCLPFRSESIWIQFPNTNNDLFILLPYSCLWFLPPVAFYEPAKSTRLNFPINTYSLVLCAFYLV